jgi:hypothetical protein
MKEVAIYVPPKLRWLAEASAARRKLRQPAEASLACRSFGSAS